MLARHGDDVGDFVRLASRNADEACEGAKVVRPITDPSRLLPAPPAALTQYHHVFPQAPDLAARFGDIGIDIHKYTMQIPKELHQQIHGGGPKGGAWNQAWRNFFETNKDATPVDVYREAGRLIHQFQLPGVPVVPYPRR